MYKNSQKYHIFMSQSNLLFCLGFRQFWTHQETWTLYRPPMKPTG